MTDLKNVNVSFFDLDMQSEKVWEAKTQSAAFCRNQAKEVKCSKAKAGYCPEEETKNFDKSQPWFASIFKKI